MKYRVVNEYNRKEIYDDIEIGKDEKMNIVLAEIAEISEENNIIPKTIIKAIPEVVSNNIEKKVDKETNIITDVKFMTFGCGSAIATSSMATELIKGKPLEEAIKLTKAKFKSGDRMLWNAKMRFGKTLTALQVAKEMGFTALKTGIATLNRPYDNEYLNNTDVIENRRDFYNYGIAQEDDFTTNSNMTHVYMGSENVKLYPVSYEYTGTIPENLSRGSFPQ